VATVARRTRLFATTVPGLGRLLRHQLDAIEGTVITGTGFDGYADIVFLEADRVGQADVLRSRLADDVFAEIGRAAGAGSRGPAAVAAVAWQVEEFRRALSLWAAMRGPVASSMTYKVNARVRSDARFRRADLRRALADLISRDRPRWRFADPARLDISVLEFHDGQYVAGLRLGGAGGGQRGDARLPSVAPAVAAAMVELAGPPWAAGLLVDPRCREGTILAEALAAGWVAEGMDVDPAAVGAAARLAPRASVVLGDASDLLLPDDYAEACVTWLPSGQLWPTGAWASWVGAALAEMSRVIRRGGAVVVLAPELPRPAVPSALRLRRQVPVRLPAAESIWVFRRS
jgi:SAM-dependent methyltransferase